MNKCILYSVKTINKQTSILRKLQRALHSFYSCCTSRGHGDEQIYKLNAPLATNRLGDRLQRLHSIRGSFGVSSAVLNLNDERNNLNFSPGSLTATAQT